jgi:hypothetical protein
VHQFSAISAEPKMTFGVRSAMGAGFLMDKDKLPGAVAAAKTTFIRVYYDDYRQAANASHFLKTAMTRFLRNLHQSARNERNHGRLSRWMAHVSAKMAAKMAEI